MDLSLSNFHYKFEFYQDRSGLTVRYYKRAGSKLEIMTLWIAKKGENCIVSSPTSSATSIFIHLNECYDAMKEYKSLRSRWTRASKNKRPDNGKTISYEYEVTYK